MNFIFVALGGAVGAMARYAISLIPLKTEFPFLTLITNVIGAILIGFIAGITSGRDGVSRNMVLFWGSSAIIRYYCYIPCTSTLLQATACHIFHTLYVLSLLICY